MGQSLPILIKGILFNDFDLYECLVMCSFQRRPLPMCQQKGTFFPQVTQSRNIRGHTKCQVIYKYALGEKKEH